MIIKFVKVNFCYMKFKKKYIGFFYFEYFFCGIMVIVFIVIDDLF